MKLKYLFTFFCLIGASHCFAQASCDDPDAWNYNPNLGVPLDSCIYFEECPTGEVLRVIQHIAQDWAYGTEIFVTSTDFEDTLVSTVFTPTNIWPTQTGDINYIPVCIDPDECYYIDFYLPEPRNGLGALNTVYIGDLLSFDQYYLQGTTNAFLSHYRKPLGSYGDACPLIGCTDTLATNYAPSAVDNFGCVPCDETVVKIQADFVINDNITWNISNEDGYVAGGGISHDSAGHVRTACLDSGCYNFNLTGDAFYFTQVQLLTAEDSVYTTMTLSLDGIASFPFGINASDCADPDAIYGCTNPLSLNYNPAATVDDGSCDLQNDNCDLSLTVYLDSLQEEIIIQPEIYSTDYPVYLFWDMGDGTPIFETWVIEPAFHTFEFPGVYEVCATFYALQFFNQEPLCYQTECVTIDTEAMGFQGPAQILIADSTLSTNNHNVERLKFYPNPASDEVRLSGDFPNFSEIRLYTLDGRWVEEEVGIKRDGLGVVLDVSTLNGGVYIVQALSKKKSLRRSISNRTVISQNTV